MKINKYIISLLCLVVALASIGSVMAVTGTIELVLPTPGEVVTGTFILNVTNSTDGGFDEIASCTFNFTSSLTANTTFSIPVVVNDSAFNVNTTFDSLIIEDSNDYTVTANCLNASGDDASDSVTFTVDNTIPQAASSLSPIDKFVDADGSVTFSGTVTGINTTSCTLQFLGVLPPGGNGQVMTHTGDTCSLTLDVPDQTYTWFIRASDELNTTDSSSVQVTADVKTSAGKAALLIQQEGVTSAGGAVLTIASDKTGLARIPLFVWIIIGASVAFAIFRKK